MSWESRLGWNFSIILTVFGSVLYLSRFFLILGTKVFYFKNGAEVGWGWGGGGVDWSSCTLSLIKTTKFFGKWQTLDFSLCRGNVFFLKWSSICLVGEIMTPSIFRGNAATPPQQPPQKTRRERGRRGRKPLPMPAFHNPACPFNAELGACEPFPRSLVHRAPTWQRGEIPSSPRRVDPYLITYEPLFTVSPWHLRKNRCSPTSTCD